MFYYRFYFTCYRSFTGGDSHVELIMMFSRLCLLLHLIENVYKSAAVGVIESCAM